MFAPYCTLHKHKCLHPIIHYTGIYALHKNSVRLIADDISVTTNQARCTAFSQIFSTLFYVLTNIICRSLLWSLHELLYVRLWLSKNIFLSMSRWRQCLYVTVSSLYNSSTLSKAELEQCTLHLCSLFESKILFSYKIRLLCVPLSVTCTGVKLIRNKL